LAIGRARRLESNRLRCGVGRFIEAMAQPLRHALNLDLTRSREYSLEQNLPFNLQISRFIRLR
jgi:hypothetical protein